MKTIIENLIFYLFIISGATISSLGVIIIWNYNYFILQLLAITIIIFAFCNLYMFINKE